jgi:hypothetical protein
MFISIPTYSAPMAIPIPTKFKTIPTQLLLQQQQQQQQQQQLLLQQQQPPPPRNAE